MYKYIKYIYIYINQTFSVILLRYIFLRTYNSINKNYANLSFVDTDNKNNKFVDDRTLRNIL